MSKKSTMPNHREIKCWEFSDGDREPYAYVIERKRSGNDAALWDVYVVNEPDLQYEATFADALDEAIKFAEKLTR